MAPILKRPFLEVFDISVRKTGLANLIQNASILWPNSIEAKEGLDRYPVPS
jgi:hypothetical protein